MARSVVIPAVVAPILRVLAVPAAPAVTPRTTFAVESMKAVPPAIGAAPPDQFEPTVQSLLVAPVQVWADADPADSAVSVATDAPVRKNRCFHLPRAARDAVARRVVFFGDLLDHRTLNRAKCCFRHSQPVRICVNPRSQRAEHRYQSIKASRRQTSWVVCVTCCHHVCRPSFIEVSTSCRERR